MSFTYVRHNPDQISHSLHMTLLAYTGPVLQVTNICTVEPILVATKLYRKATFYSYHLQILQVRKLFTNLLERTAATIGDKFHGIYHCIYGW